MQLDRSTKTFIAIFTLVACFILAVNHAVNSDPLEDWALAAVLLLISIVFWVWLWQENAAEATAITTDATPTSQEWVISEELVSTLENATPPKPIIAPEPEVPVVSGSPAEELDNVTNEVVEAMPDEAEVVEDAKEGEPVAEAKVGEAMAANKEATEEKSVPEPIVEEEPIPEPTVEVVVVEEDQNAVETLEVPAADDLTRVEGIGPKYSTTLINAGVSTFEQVSKMSEEDLTKIIRDAGMRRPASIVTWAEQAALAAKGDWDALAALQEQLNGGRPS